MKSIKIFNRVFALFFTMILLTLPVPARADWSPPVPAPNFTPAQGQLPQHEPRLNNVPSIHVEPQHHKEPAQTARNNAPPAKKSPVYQYHKAVPYRSYSDQHYYKHLDYNFTYEVVNPVVSVPDGFEIGTIVDSIPENYEVIMADGVNYLFADGVYFERVEQGFEVVEGPGSDQE